MEKLGVIEVYKSILNGERKYFPKGYWKTADAEINAERLLEYLFKTKLNISKEDIVNTNIVRVLRDNKLGSLSTSLELFNNEPVKSPLYSVARIYGIEVWELKSVPTGHWDVEEGRIKYIRWAIEKYNIKKDNYRSTDKYKYVRCITDRHGYGDLDKMFGGEPKTALSEHKKSNDYIREYIIKTFKDYNVDLAYIKSNWRQKQLTKYIPTLVRSHTISELYKIVFNEESGYHNKSELKTISLNSILDIIRNKVNHIEDNRIGRFTRSIKLEYLEEICELYYKELLRLSVDELRRNISGDWLYNILKAGNTYGEYGYPDFYKALAKVYDVEVWEIIPYKGIWNDKEIVSRYTKYLVKKYKVDENSIYEMWNERSIPEITKLKVVNVSRCKSGLADTLVYTDIDIDLRLFKYPKVMYRSTKLIKYVIERNASRLGIVDYKLNLYKLLPEYNKYISKNDLLKIVDEILTE